MRRHRSEPPIVELDASRKILKMLGEKMLLAIDSRGRALVGDRSKTDPDLPSRKPQAPSLKLKRT